MTANALALRSKIRPGPFVSLGSFFNFLAARELCAHFVNLTQLVKRQKTRMTLLKVVKELSLHSRHACAVLTLGVQYFETADVAEREEEGDKKLLLLQHAKGRKMSPCEGRILLFMSHS